ncbi:hypothetical protein M878_18325 [Streptomyces roseochromogenus subsp. oscitans DS 12.976]|uniref:Uncharacterized protein n=1 Tax=Streptomyces roseochromogenus subsp. oscitans DS 12.976 TaxID=1352936 RepID=V6KNY8_STRRC|nr:hypothetical protein M878_18325 [Streptomyces roseochromogenus subsp. oscitans DS 12.976]
MHDSGTGAPEVMDAPDEGEGGRGLVPVSAPADK